MGGKGGPLWKQMTFHLCNQRANCGGNLTIRDAHGSIARNFLKDGFLEFLNKEIKSIQYNEKDYEGPPFDFHGGLSPFNTMKRGLELARNFQFPVLREPPSSFLRTMEEYIREAPRIAPVENKTVEYRRLDFNANQEEQSPQPPPEVVEEPVVEEVLPEPAEEPHSAAEVDDEPEPTTTADLLGLNEVNPAAAELDESNALALAIVPPGGSNKYAGAGGGFGDITT